MISVAIQNYIHFIDIPKRQLQDIDMTSGFRNINEYVNTLTTQTNIFNFELIT